MSDRCIELIEKNYKGSFETEKSNLQRGIKELIAFVISKENRASYSTSRHFKAMEDYGIDPDLAAAVEVDYRSSKLEIRIKELLSFCIAITSKDHQFNDSEIKQLLNLGWTNPGLFEAAAITIQTDFNNKLENMFQISNKERLAQPQTRTPINRDIN